MRHVWLVAGREVRETFRSKAYWISMGLLLAGLAAAIVLPRLLGSEPSYDVGVAGDVPAGATDQLASIARSADVELDLVALDDERAATRAVEGGDLDAALLFGDGPTTLVRQSRTSETLVGLTVQASTQIDAARRLADAGLDAEEATEVLAARPPVERVVDDGQPGRSSVAYGSGLVLYLALLLGGMGVATGVAVEKSTRVAEVLVTVVRPAHLLAGKVLGSGATTLLLVLAAAIPVTTAIAVGAIDVPSAAALDVVTSVGWFVLGFATYATGFAALGALVDRQEDLGGAVGPLTSALILSYLATFQVQQAPDAPFAVALSIFPLSAPMIMPVRISEGAASVPEVIIAVLVGLATLALLVRVGSTVYRRALLRGGRRLGLIEVLRG